MKTYRLTYTTDICPNGNYGPYKFYIDGRRTTPDLFRKFDKCAEKAFSYLTRRRNKKEGVMRVYQSHSVSF